MKNAEISVPGRCYPQTKYIALHRDELGFIEEILTPQIYNQFVTQCVDSEIGKYCPR